MKPNNKRKSGLLYQKVIKKAPLFEPMRIREMPKRIYEPIELPSFESVPRYEELKPMDPVYEPKKVIKESLYGRNPAQNPEYQEMIRQKNEALENLKNLHLTPEMPEFKPLKGREKRQAKRKNIQRVADKYGITRGQARRGLRKMRRAGEDYIPEEYLSSLKMVKRNSAVPFKLPHQSNAALHSNHHDFDPKNREIYENMSQDVKDSLHLEANKYGKPFWSDQHQVNVDPEDGVLSNRPRVKSTGEYFKYEPINKPYSNAAPKQVVSSSGGDDTIDYSNMTPEQKASLADFWKSEIEAYGGIEPGSEGYTELVGGNRYAVYDRGRFNPRNQTYQFDKPQWRMKGGGPEYDNPKGIHPDQLMRMYQGDDNVYE